MGESFFPEFERPVFRKLRTHGRGVRRRLGVSGGQTPSLSPESLCVECPCEATRKGRKVFPALPPGAKLVVVGMAPGVEEELQGVPFVGRSGELLRAVLRAAGLDAEREVGYMNLGRCRPVLDDFDSPAWREAERRCGRYFTQDLARVAAPLLLLGSRPVARLLGSNKERVGYHRGLWVRTADGRRAFVARHPAQILRTSDAGTRQRLEREFREDLTRMVSALLVGGMSSGVDSVKVFTSAFEAREFLQRLRSYAAPWAFDIESYDAREFPARSHVSTDPCHPDFRLRGIAIAWGPTRGVWIECRGSDDRRVEACTLLSPAFESPAEKWAFNGGFDEEGLVYPGWVREVRHRRGDGMLALIALGNGRHDSLRLEKAAVDILKMPQHWEGVAKERMRDLPLGTVARGAVGDACRTFQLCRVLHERIQRGEYL